MTTVIVIGGGVAGMSAAHELIERGYTVRVFERQDLPGGKARSVSVDGTGTEGRKDLPGEHGFRFFPRFYRHIIDTMDRIPVGDHSAARTAAAAYIAEATGAAKAAPSPSQGSRHSNQVPRRGDTSTLRRRR